MPEKYRSQALSRRTIISAVGTGIVGASVGATVTADPEYSETVDIVEAGADNTGSETIDDVLEAHADDDTLIEFPDGRYEINSVTLYGLSNFGMVGTGDAVLVPGDGYDPRLWIAGTNNRNIRIENFTIDNTDDGVGSTLNVSAYDGLVVRNIEKLGYHDVDRPAFGFRVIDDDGNGVVENLQCSDGGQSVGIYTDPSGEITYRDCHVEGFNNNGLYGSLGSGPVHIEGGYYRNNNVSSIRLGTSGSSVSDTTIVVEDPPESFENCRGIRIADGVGPVHVEDCTLELTSGRGTGGIVGAFSGGSFTVRGTAIRIGEEYTTVGSGGQRTSYAIYVDPATQSEVGSRTIEDTVIKGSGNYVAPVRFARDNNELRNVCIEQSGHQRDGIVFVDSNDNVVEDSAITVPGEQIRLEGDSSVDRRNISSGVSCEWPTAESETEADGDTITITGREETAHYEFTVDGTVEKSTAHGGTINDYDTVHDDGTVTGRTTNEPDSYTYDGTITSFTTTDDVTVSINGEEVHPEMLGGTILTIEGDGETVHYEFTADGSVSKSTAYGGTINEYDTIHSDGTVTGRTTNEPDSFSCTGVIREFEADGPVTVYVDGEPINVD